MDFLLDHIAIKVDDMERACSLFKLKGATLDSLAYYPEVGMQIAFLSLNGSVYELLKPVDAFCPIAGINDGLHHIAIAVDSIEQMHSAISASGSFEAVQPIRKGRHGRIFFFSIKGMPLIQYECMEKQHEHE